MVGNWPMKHNHTQICMYKMIMYIKLIIKLLWTGVFLKLRPKAFPQNTEYHIGEIIRVHVHRPPKVWHHWEHKRHARVLIPTLEYLLPRIITNWDYSVTISSYMYMNCVFDANLNDNKWVYVLQGHFLDWMKIIANLTKIDSLHNWP